MSEPEFSEEQHQKMAEMFRREWGGDDQSPIMEFVQHMRQSPTLQGALMVLHALPQWQCDCPRCFYEKVQLAEVMALRVADLRQKVRDGEMTALVDRGRQLYQQLAEEGLDASDMLAIAGMLLNGMVFTIAKTVTDKGRKEL